MGPKIHDPKMTQNLSFKNYYYLLTALSFCFLLSRCNPSTRNPVPEGFVLIPESNLIKKNDTINVGAFEILDHPITNAEYQHFVKATGHPAPYHWKNGQIPKGYDDYPVIYITREDADKYARWLTKTDGRVYTLPTPAQFEIAARANKKDGKYFWGDDEKPLRDSLVNYDAHGNRSYDRWKDYLKPAKWGLQNEWGLYGMAGNVWQLTQQNQDPQASTYKYRIEASYDMERNLMGGSWARSEEYLACGLTVGQSPALRAPDVGFRLVRAPENINWEPTHRKLIAVTNQAGNISLSWALRSSDKPYCRFNIYRLESAYRASEGVKINTTPLVGTTSFEDKGPFKTGKRYQYRVVCVDQDGREINRSEWAGMTYAPNTPAEVVTFAPLYQNPGFVPVFGDLDGDGKLDCVIRLANGNVETSQDPGTPVQIEAFTSYGRSLWRKDIAHHENIYGSAYNCPFNVWDMDGDGKAEIITLLQIDDKNYVAILDGMTGKVKHTHRWPEMVSDFSRSSTRIQMSVGYLDGVNPAVITQTGIYENEVITAFDAQLNHLWTFNSFGPTNGSSGHKVEIADVDGDGKQEVVYGTTCLNWDGTLRWSIYRQHPDIISVQDYLPDNPGLEVFYLVESSIHAGAYLVDASSGKIIWKNNREDDKRWSHGHAGWTADIWDGSPGMECVVNRAGHHDRNFVVFSAKGEILQEPFPAEHFPIEWDGDNTRELIWDNGRSIGNWNGTKVVEVENVHPNPIPESKLLYTADLYGDFRDELVVLTKSADGREIIKVLTATDEIQTAFITPSDDLHYRLWIARNMGGGYRSVYDTPYRQPLE